MQDLNACNSEKWSCPGDPSLLIALEAAWGNPRAPQSTVETTGSGVL